MINIRTAVLHNGVDASAEYAKKVAEQITDECAVVDAYTNAPLRHVLPLRAVPNVMVCLFCDGLEEYQEVAEIINRLNEIKSADFTTATFIEQSELGNVDAETAAQHTELFTAWASGVAYTVDALRQYEGQLYKCIQAHTSQDDWTPDVAVSLWVKAYDPSIEFPEWVQPTGAHDAYAMGAKVSHNGKNWVSDIDANTYEPSVYGWSEVAS